MKFWKYGRVALALMGSVVFGLSITCCGVYTSGYMYVLGSQPSSGQAGAGAGQAGVIGAFKIDHDYGYLTPIQGSPFSSGGTDPVQAVVITGGRFLAVLNKGQNGAGAGVTMFTIGGSGVLYSQQSYTSSGSNPVSIGLDPGGNYLYVVDQLAPDNSGRGDITVFTIDQQTGRLTLVTNPNDLSSNGVPLTYFEVNYKPVQVVTAGAGSSGSFVYVLDQAYNPGTSGVPAACLGGGAPQGCVTPDVFVYGSDPKTGVLNLTQNAPLQIGTLPGAASTIANGGGHIYIADTANGQNSGQILAYTIGPGGVLQTQVGTPVQNQPGAGFYPDAILTSSNGQFLYVANFGPSPIVQPNSNISAYTLVSGTQPQVITGSPFPTGSGPIWMALDPTNQYLYTANFNDNTITGSLIGATYGSLKNLSKGGSVFKTVSQPTFVVVSSRTY